MTVIHWGYHSLLDPGNLLASFIAGGVATEIGRRTIWRWHIRPHFERTKEIHAAIVKGKR